MIRAIVSRRVGRGGGDDEEEVLKRCEQEGNGCEFSSECGDFKRQKNLRKGNEGEKYKHNDLFASASSSSKYHFN